MKVIKSAFILGLGVLMGGQAFAYQCLFPKPVTTTEGPPYTISGLGTVIPNSGSCNQNPVIECDFPIVGFYATLETQTLKQEQSWIAVCNTSTHQWVNGGINSVTVNGIETNQTYCQNNYSTFQNSSQKLFTSIDVSNNCSFK